MSKEKTNDLTAYDLIQAVKITSKNNSDLKFIFRTTKANVTNDDKYLYTCKTDSIIEPCEYDEDDITTLIAFKRLRRFCKLARNKYSILDMISKMYKLNKDNLKIKIIVFPTIREKDDVRFAINELFN